jgi:ATP-binding cassette, subfamily B, bacterial
MKTQSKASNSVIKYYWQHAWNYPRRVIGLLVAVPLTVLINAYLPSLILANVLSRLSQHQFDAHDLWGSFGTQIVLYGVLLISGIAMWRIVDWFSWHLEQDVQRDIAQQVFKHLLSRSADFHANNFSGTLVSHTNKLLGSYVRVSDTTVYQVYPMLCGFVIAIIILAPRAPLFAVALGVFASLYMGAAFMVSRPVRRLGRAHATYESRQTGYLADAIGNAMVIKSFARTRYEEQRFASATEDTRRHLRVFMLAHQKQMSTLGVMNRIISATSLLIAVIAVMKFNANIATVFLIFNYTSTSVEQLFNFANGSLRSYNRAIGDATDIVTTLAEEPEIQDPQQPEQLRMHTGAITFKDVTFTHNGADEAVFDKLGLHIKPGEKIGLVGHSGSGKTTLTRLLLRFSDIQKGEILIDGQNIARVTQTDLHGQIAYVPQEPLLFHRSIRENIAYGDPAADDHAIEAAAKMASAHDFITDLPQGYDTLVGERGVKLSGGQRQRIAIARAMLKNAPILALDEATSALDSESEVLIQAALWKLMEGRTAIVIAHRLSTIQKMDRILVLDKGKIVEQGSHKELITKRGGTYAKLWAHQSGGFIDD